MKILMLGDVNGAPGRRMLKEHVNRLKKELGLAAVVANGENAAGGNGLTAAIAKEIFKKVYRRRQWKNKIRWLH